MEYEFIDNLKMNKKSRQLIRSHVMKGKNAGRSLKHVRKSRSLAYDADAAGYSAPLPVQLLHHVLDEVRRGQAAKDPKKTALAIRNWVVDDFSYFPFPLKVTPQVHYLLHCLFSGVGDALYPPEFCLQINLMKSLWLQYMIEDEAVFHSMLAITAAMIDFFLARNETSPAVLTHMSQTFRLLNHKLSGKDALSDTSLAIVVLLVIYEQIRGDETKSQLHYAGLHRMIKLRGGLSTLRGNCPLAQKICRADIEAALQTGSTKFIWDDIPPEAMTLLLPSWLCQTGPLPPSFAGLSVELQNIAANVMLFTGCLNSAFFCPSLDPFSYQGILLSFWYRLLPLQVPAVPATREHDLTSRVQEAVLAGLISFMTTTLLQFGRQRILPYNRIAKKLKESLNVLMGTTLDMSILLWLFFVGAISVFDTPDQEWAAFHIKRIIGSVDMCNWSTVHKMLSQYPWINALHNEAARAVYDSVTGGH